MTLKNQFSCYGLLIFYANKRCYYGTNKYDSTKRVKISVNNVFFPLFISNKLNY